MNAIALRADYEKQLFYKLVQTPPKKVCLGQRSLRICQKHTILCYKYELLWPLVTCLLYILMFSIGFQQVFNRQTHFCFSLTPFPQLTPLPFSASLVFLQIYPDMDMDSASSVVLQALTQATSQDTAVLKPAEEQLRQWETQPGFYSVLLVRTNNSVVHIALSWLLLLWY